MAGSRERRSTRAAAWSMGAARAEVAADLAGVEGGGAAASGEERGRGSRARARAREREGIEGEGSGEGERGDTK